MAGREFSTMFEGKQGTARRAGKRQYAIRLSYVYEFIDRQGSVWQVESDVYLPGDPNVCEACGESYPYAWLARLHRWARKNDDEHGRAIHVYKVPREVFAGVKEPAR